MSERKSSLGRGAASIFSGVSQPSEDESRKSEEEKPNAEKLKSESATHMLNDERSVVGIQESSAEIQEMKAESASDEFHPSAVDTPKLIEDKKFAEDLQTSAESQQSTIVIQKANAENQNLDMISLEQAIQEGTKYPKVTVYSPLIASFMRYKEITIPRFKLSPEAEGRLERVLKRENPALWRAAEERVRWNKKKEPQGLKYEPHAVDLASVEQSIEEGTKYPKITIYSPVIAAFLRYLEFTIPRFKLSPAVEGRLEKVLKREDPELWRAIEERISWRKRKR